MRAIPALLAGCLLASLSCVGAPPDSSDVADDKAVEALLRERVEKLTPRLPEMIDKQTRLDSATPGPGRRLTYVFTLMDPAAESGLHDRIGSVVVHRGCTDRSAVELIDRHGVSYIFRYQDKDGKEIITVTLTAKECEAFRQSQRSMSDEAVKAFLDDQARLTSKTLGPGDSVSVGPGRQMNFVTTLKKPAFMLEAAGYRELLPQSLLNHICPDPSSQDFFLKGITIVYRYRDSDEKDFMTVTVTPKDCETWKPLPMPSRNAGQPRDTRSCLKYVDDLSQRHGEAVHNDCDFPVWFAYCWLNAPEEKFSCDKQHSMQGAADPGKDSEVYATTPRTESKRLAWVACEKGILPKIRWLGNQPVNEGCKK